MKDSRVPLKKCGLFINGDAGTKFLAFGDQIKNGIIYGFTAIANAIFFSVNLRDVFLRAF